jgi:putative NADH-flavin reductase
LSGVNTPKKIGPMLKRADQRRYCLPGGAGSLCI